MPKIEKRDKKSRKKSSCWQFYTKNDRGGICKLCEKLIISNGNTTNLLNHLKRKHRIQWETATEENGEDFIDTQMEFEVEEEDQENKTTVLHRSTKEAHEQGMAYQSSDGQTVIWLHPDVQLDQLSAALQPQMAVIEHAASSNNGEEMTLEVSEDKDGTSILRMGELIQKKEDTISSEEVAQKADTTNQDHPLVTYAMVLNNGEMIQQDNTNTDNIAQIVTVSSSEDPSTEDNNPVSSSPSKVVLANFVTSDGSNIILDDVKTSPSKIGKKRTVVVTQCPQSLLKPRPIQPKPEWIPIKMVGQNSLNSFQNKSSVPSNVSIVTNTGEPNSTGNYGEQNSAGKCGAQNSIANHAQNSAGKCGAQNSIANHAQNSAGNCGAQNSTGSCGKHKSDDNYIGCCKQKKAKSYGAHREDSFDHFGKYIATLLRNLPSKKSSSRLQREMLNWVLKEQMLFED